jgi:hypothetical protein
MLRRASLAALLALMPMACAESAPADPTPDTGAGDTADSVAPDTAPDTVVIDTAIPEVPACDPATVDHDPYNCGTCGTVCKYPNAEGNCTAGACEMGKCQPGFYDIDTSAPGCEYACWPSDPPTEICDGIDNDCNGQIDEGFDLQNDPKHCGACAVACVSANGTPSCVAGKCTLGACEVGYVDLDKLGANGCEYKCPVWPTKAETCNGKDDDCNGIPDDSPSGTGVSCDTSCPAPDPCVAAGTCKFPTSTCVGQCCGICTAGKTVCAGGGLECVGGQAPKAEICNGADDNCDGQIDEGFDFSSDPNNCGKCGGHFDLPNAVTGCAGGAATIVTCKPGFFDKDKIVANGCEYTCPVWPPTAESCNGKDDDCNGVVDDALTTPPNNCIQTGPCAGAKPVCGGAAGWKCNYQAVNPKIEVDATGALALVETMCDGFDGNCNSQVDESWSTLGKPCGTGVGACAGTGTIQCSTDGKGVTCPAVATATNATDEVCDGIDNDCDGVVDERASGPGTCYNGGAHTCLGWVDPMVKVGSVYVYTFEASRTDATAAATGSGATRACSKAGVQPWVSVSETQAAAACAAIKDSAGAPMRLCSATEWSNACSLGNASSSVWSYATNNTTYVGTTCNGADAGKTGPWASGSGASCYANQSLGKIYDLSGNVAEWTSTTVSYSGATYYKVRGGSYGTPASGLSCNFDFVIQTPGYLNVDLGFRCCADNAP